ncbi:hypothetical protein NGTWS1803_11170 [Mycolicibacterium cyprinidarum]|nr:hypothetical protein NGTWS1803_11170 [Mycolicibacterium sp. NGTWS1803]
MRSNTYVLATAAMAIGLIAAGCGSSSDSKTTTETKTVTVSPTETATTGATTRSEQPTPTTTSNAGTDLQSLIPTPADTRETDGPDSIWENGVHMHFQVDGAPVATMDAYQTDLEAKGWSVTVRNSGGGGRGGGATFTGTNNDAYGVFTGGGHGTRTHIEACVWPTEPSNTDCDD